MEIRCQHSVMVHLEKAVRTQLNLHPCVSKKITNPQGADWIVAVNDHALRPEFSIDFLHEVLRDVETRSPFAKIVIEKDDIIRRASFERFDRFPVRAHRDDSVLPQPAQETDVALHVVVDNEDLLHSGSAPCQTAAKPFSDAAAYFLAAAMLPDRFGVCDGIAPLQAAM